jgi:hypothetical protein
MNRGRKGLSARVADFARATLLASIASIAFAAPAHASISASASVESPSYVRGTSNTFRFHVVLFSTSIDGSDIESADSVGFAFPSSFRVSALRFEDGTQNCVDTQMIVDGLGSNDAAFANTRHPSGCGFFQALPDGSEQVFSVDVDVPEDFVGDLPLRVVVEGAGSNDGGTHEAIVDWTLPDDVSPARWHFDPALAPALPRAWSSDSLGGNEWTTVATDGAADVELALPQARSDSALQSPSLLVGSAGGELRFRHTLDANAGHDGAALEIAIADAGFVDIVEAGGIFVTGGYDATLGDASSCAGVDANPLAGRRGWESATNARVVATLPPAAAGQSIRLRWRLGTDCIDETPRAAGWAIDDIELVGTAPVALVSPTRMSLALAINAAREERLTIANTGGDTLDYAVFGADSDCAVPVDLPWLALPPAGTVAGGMAVDLAVGVRSAWLEQGRHDALICVQASGAIVPMPLSVEVTPNACAEPSIFANGFEEDAGAASCTPSLRVYADRNAFVRALTPTYSDEPFTGLRPGPLLAPVRFCNEVFGYSIFVGADALNPALRIFAGSGGISPESAADALRVGLDTGAARAVGGYFRAATFEPFETRLQAASRVQLTLGDGSVETIDAPVADGFRGFISDLPIRSLDIRTLDLDDEGNLPWALLDELFVGAPR